MPSNVIVNYIPHGSNPKIFRPILSDDPDYTEFLQFQDDFCSKNGVDFVIFWNNRNIRRKQPGDIMLAYRYFCDNLPPEKAKRVCLFMKTAVVDENGTDLMAVKRMVCPNYKVLFNQELIEPKYMNFLYNLSDVTVSLSSAEGFGLSFNESILAGTCVSGPVTGGLQDQMRFEDENGKWIEFTDEFPTNHTGRYKKCGSWAFPLFPSARALQGSVPTPFIFDDYCNAEDLGKVLLELHGMTKYERDQRGLKGREWALSQESMMSSPVMCEKFIESVDMLFSTWKKPSKFELIKIEDRKSVDNIGIVWRD